MIKHKIPGIFFPIALSLLILFIAVSPAMEFTSSHAPQNTDEAVNTLGLFLLSGIFFYVGLLMIMSIWASYFLIYRKKSRENDRGTDS